MQDTTFYDLTARLGNKSVYVFSHMGCCEHRIRIADARLVNAADPQIGSKYPLLLAEFASVEFSVTGGKRCCGVCGGAPVRWLVLQVRLLFCKELTYIADILPNVGEKILLSMNMCADGTCCGPSVVQNRDVGDVM